MKSPASLITAVGLLVGGSWEVRQQSGEFAAVLLAAGLIMLGVWIALEVRSAWTRKGDGDDESGAGQE